MPTRKVTFDNGRGDLLTARLELPIDGEPLAFALFAHCFTCSKDLKAVRWIVDAMNRSGIAVLRFDFTGLGESEGDFADTDFSSNVEDLIAACGYLGRDHQAPALLVGHSLGGAAVLMAAAQLDSVTAVATIGAPSTPEHVAHLLEDDREEIEKKGEATVTIAGRSFTVRKDFLADLESANMERTLGSLGTPLLVLHSPVDDVVGIDNAREIFMAAKHPKSFVSLDSADHLLTRERDARYAGEVIAGWSRRYLSPDKEDARRKSWKDDIHDNRVMVRTEDSLRTEGMANGFGIVLDEPEEVGGTDSGPTPYDYLGAALGACTSMTLRMYADRKSWPLDAVTVEVRHGKVHAEDCKECEEKPTKLDRFERHIRLEGALDDDQRARLLQIANRCPVHRTLESDVRIETTLHE